MKTKIWNAFKTISAYAAFTAVFLAFASSDDFIIRRSLISVPFVLLSVLLHAKQPKRKD